MNAAILRLDDFRDEQAAKAGRWLDLNHALHKDLPGLSEAIADAVTDFMAVRWNTYSTRADQFSLTVNDGVTRALQLEEIARRKPWTTPPKGAA